MRLLKQKDIDEIIITIKKHIKKNLVISDVRSVCLVSKSPRRRECLKSIISDIKTDSVDDKEELVMFSDMKNIAYYLALQKLKLFLEEKVLNKDRFIITADTIVYYQEENKLLGKPENKEQAEQMLRYHLGKQHTVASALVLADRCNGKIYSVVDTADVEFRAYKESMKQYIQKYLQLKPPQGPLDKAGAYGVQETLIKEHFIKSVEGDKNTVIGFPMQRFKKLWADIISL